MTCCRLFLAQFPEELDSFKPSEAIRLEQPAHLDLGFSAMKGGIGKASGLFDRYSGWHLNDGVTGNEFFGFGEGSSKISVRFRST